MQVIYRQDLYDYEMYDRADLEKSCVGEIIVLKNRSGNVGTVKLWWDECAGWSDYMKENKFERADVNCIFGRNTDGNCISILTLKELLLGTVCVEGKLVYIEEEELVNGDYILKCKITDNTSVISFKVFVKKEDKDCFLKELIIGNTYKVKGTVGYDSNENDLSFSSVLGIKPLENH